MKDVYFFHFFKYFLASKVTRYIFIPLSPLHNVLDRENLYSFCERLTFSTSYSGAVLNGAKMFHMLVKRVCFVTFADNNFEF